MPRRKMAGMRMPTVSRTRHIRNNSAGCSRIDDNGHDGAVLLGAAHLARKGAAGARAAGQLRAATAHDDGDFAVYSGGVGVGRGATVQAAIARNAIIHQHQVAAQARRVGREAASEHGRAHREGARQARRGRDGEGGTNRVVPQVHLHAAGLAVDGRREVGVVAAAAILGFGTHVVAARTLSADVLVLEVAGSLVEPLAHHHIVEHVVPVEQVRNRGRLAGFGPRGLVKGKIEVEAGRPSGELVLENRLPLPLVVVGLSS